MSDVQPVIVETRFRWAAYLTALACVITRAPTLMEDGEIFELPLAINVGYVVFFGPLIILLFYIDALRSMGHANGIKDNGDDFVFKIIVYAPALLSAFLSLQYFLEVRPNSSCNASDWTALIGWSEFQAVYCISNNAQEQMPWVMKPPLLFAIAQVAMPMVSVSLARRAVNRVRGSNNARMVAQTPQV